MAIHQKVQEFQQTTEVSTDYTGSNRLQRFPPRTEGSTNDKTRQEARQDKYRIV